MEKILSLNVLLLILVLVSSASTREIRYVRPNDSSSLSCPGQPCLTLDQYKQQTTTYFTTGSSFVFLAGNHTLLSAIKLKDISEVTFTRENDSDVTILMWHRKGVFIRCTRVTGLKIAGLKFDLHLSKLNKEVSVLKFFDSIDILIDNAVFRGSGDLGETLTKTRALYIKNSTLTAVRCLFEGNTGEKGGAIYAIFGSTIVLNSSIFTGNRANIEGGAIFLQGCALALNGNIFDGNRAELEGGAISAELSSIHISGIPASEFQHFTCNMIAKSNFFSSYTTLAITIDDPLFTPGTAYFSNNEAQHHNGGAIQLYGSNNITFGGTAVVFRNNSAPNGNGGAFFSYAEFDSFTRTFVTVRAYSTHFSNNRVAFDGGAISMTHGFKLFVQESLNFSENLAIGNGGAIKLDDGEITLAGSSHFHVNSASKSGGALWLNNVDFILMNSSEFSKNKAFNYGGAIYLSNTYGILNGSIAKFEGNSAVKGGGIYSRGSQLLANAKIIFLHNVAKKSGGALHLYANAYDEILEVIISAANFTNNRALECGGAVFVEQGKNIHFKNLLAIGNSGSALCILQSEVNFSGTTNISENTGRNGGGMQIISRNYVLFKGRAFFNSNRAVYGGAIYSFYETILMLSGSIKFEHNIAEIDGGAIYALGTNVTFKKWSAVMFSYNSAVSGGAMYLNNAAFLTLNYGATLYTSNNHASKHGGAIYHEDDIAIPSQCKFDGMDQLEIIKLPYCFMQFTMTLLGIDYFITATVKSNNDSSVMDGSFIYGGLLDRCQIPYQQLQQEDGQNTIVQKSIVPYKLLPNRFYINNSVNINTIASQPYQLCLCTIDRSPTCSNGTNIEVNRGQTFTIYLLAIDQLKASTATQITAKVRKTARLKLDQSLQPLEPNCSGLSYAIYSTKSAEELTLYPDGPCRDTGVARVVVNIRLLPCPDGFKKSNEQCICEERLEEYGAQCLIDENIYIVRKNGSTFWINATYTNGSYQGVIRYKTCPTGYCKYETVKLTFDNPNIQCANFRSGILCGACAANYSLMLGSSRCGECSNTYLALLLPFAAAGIALVIFLSILRLTVATGMINSVILYANIVQVNRKAFLSTSSVTTNVFTVFIAWFNLDLGFETCFYKSMTAYAQTWLQFAFPVYVWVLITLIILTSRYSIIISKLIGHNPISVLATLLLMSYAKLLRIIVEVFSSVTLDLPQNKTIEVWLKDANVPYLQSWHLLLTVVTSLVSVLIPLPPIYYPSPAGI